MSCMNAIDTNVLIYAVQNAATDKTRRATALLDGLCAELPSTLLPWQVVCEFLAFLAKSRQRIGTSDHGPEIAELVDAVALRFPIAMPSERVVGLAIDIHLHDQVSIWDALLLAACVDAGVTTLYTEDLQSRPVIRGVRLVNPFS
jgi:predicted nucleic acid-binding protein